MTVAFTVVKAYVDLIPLPQPESCVFVAHPRPGQPTPVIMMTNPQRRSRLPPSREALGHHRSQVCLMMAIGVFLRRQANRYRSQSDGDQNTNPNTPEARTA